MSELISEANTELEVSLSNDTSGTFKQQLIDQLYREHSKINKHLSKGLVPDQYQKFNALSEAINQSIKVVEKMWVKFHG